jgi:hypothetical protein
MESVYQGFSPWFGADAPIFLDLLLYLIGTILSMVDHVPQDRKMPVVSLSISRI